MTNYPSFAWPKCCWLVPGGPRAYVIFAILHNFLGNQVRITTKVFGFAVPTPFPSRQLSPFWLAFAQQGTSVSLPRASLPADIRSSERPPLDRFAFFPVVLSVFFNYLGSIDIWLSYGLLVRRCRMKRARSFGRRNTCRGRFGALSSLCSPRCHWSCHPSGIQMFCLY